MFLVFMLDTGDTKIKICSSLKWSYYPHKAKINSKKNKNQEERSTQKLSVWKQDDFVQDKPFLWRGDERTWRKQSGRLILGRWEEQCPPEALPGELAAQRCPRLVKETGNQDHYVLLWDFSMSCINATRLADCLHDNRAYPQLRVGGRRKCWLVAECKIMLT